MRTRTSAHRRPVPRRRARPGLLLLGLAAAALATLTLAVYRGAFGHAFVDFDDSAYVTENALVLGRHFGALLRAVVAHNFHPLTMLSLALNVTEPLRAGPFILTNVLLHVLNTLLVFWLGYLLCGRRLLPAAFMGLLFGIHPMHVESVAWASERKDVLHAAFYLAAAITYTMHLERRSVTRLALTFGWFVLACLAKGTAVSFPLVMVVLDFWQRRPLMERRALLEKVPFLAVALLFGAVAVNVQAGGDFHGLLSTPMGQPSVLRSSLPGTVLERLALPTWGYLMYVWRLLVPVGLCAFEPYPRPGALAGPPYVFAPFFLLATLALAVWDARRSRVITVGIAWYFATVAFVLQWIPVGMAITADRYTYLPYVGLSFLWAMGLQSVLAWRRSLGLALWVASAAFAVFLLVQTPRQVATWRDSEALWGHAIRVYPRCARLYVWRGNSRARSGRMTEAMADLQEARRLGARSPDFYDGLGCVYAFVGQPDSAVAMFDNVLGVEPDRGPTRANRAMALLMTGQPRAALADLDRALALMPRGAAQLEGLRGMAHLRLGEYDEGARALDRAVAAGAHGARTYTNRGLCRLGAGDRAGAIADFRQALRIAPADSVALVQLERLGVR